MTCSAQRTDAFCDWLDVTFSPDEDKVLLDIEDFVCSSGGSIRCEDDVSRTLNVGEGTLRLDRRSRFLRASASGSVLSHLRAHGLFLEYLGVMGDYDHAVTRLDAAVDVAKDTPPILRSLRRKYSNGKIRLSEREVKITWLTSVREDGLESGTFYAGHRSKARVTARVYDKALEMFEKYSVLLPPTTRYELTFRGEVGPSFHDAVDPSAIFYRYASPSLLTKPRSVSQWVSTAGDRWTYDCVEKTPAERLKRHVEESADLDAMIKRADQVGPKGREYLMSLLRRRIMGTE